MRTIMLPAMTSLAINVGAMATAQPVSIFGFSFHMTAEEAVEHAITVCRENESGLHQRYEGQRSAVADFSDLHSDRAYCRNPQHSAIFYSGGSDFFSIRVNRKRNTLDYISISCGMTESCSLTTEEFAMFLIENLPITHIVGDYSSVWGQYYSARSAYGEEIMIYPGGMSITRGTFGGGPTLN